MNYKNPFLETAQNIGTKLCQQSFWYDSKCNWMGRTLDDITTSGSISCKALSPDIYDGTSGIALFLANLYVCDNMKNDEYRKTSEGAINQSLSRIDDIPQISQFSFYSGQIGIAYAAAVIGKELCNQKLVEDALQIIQRLNKDTQKKYSLDLLSGIAGAILALLKIYEISDKKIALKLAIEFGNELISTSIKESIGWSWDYKSNGIQSATHNLTGFSHGAAGIGYALLELCNVTGKVEFCEAAKHAFQYENHWFSKQNKNWPDFRLDDQNINSKQERDLKFAVAWCHGAPGISLSRLRAYQILKDEIYLQDIQAAIHTTTSIVKELDIENKYQNFSLCHGFSGIGEILLHLGKNLNDNECKSLAIEIGKHGIKKYANQGIPWPCDVRVGEMLGLMTGIAGIGNFYLRLWCSNKISSPLVIEPSNNLLLRMPLEQ